MVLLRGVEWIVRVQYVLAGAHLADYLRLIRVEAVREIEEGSVVRRRSIGGAVIP